MAAVKLGDTTTNQKSAPTAEETSGKACDRGGTYVEAVLAAFGAMN
jgi:hypothetical protein